MILLTGGAGFIGSCLNAALQGRGRDVVVVDRLGTANKWRNLRSRPPQRIVPPDRLEALLAERPPVEAVVHLGAISETTATDGDLVWDSNVSLSQYLWRWCAECGVPLFYASSAATYGAAEGEGAFSDDPARLDALRPLNLYGWSKHGFDLWVRRELAGNRPAPPRWAGLKFFNVYGPNEYHKGSMISVVKVKHDELRAGGAATLFRSDRADVADGEQRRDFVWVGDVVDVLSWLLDTPAAPSGLFNLGTGEARSYADLARAVCAALGVPERIEFVAMPERLRGQYQSFTRADISRLRAAGYPERFTPLEEGIRRYVELLAGPDPYL